jgi:tetratricopeptide (TPR) repeat protein
MLLSDRPEPIARRKGSRAVPPPQLLALPFEAAPVLDEIADDFAVHLFQRARDAALWAGTAQCLRNGLFQPSPGGGIGAGDDTTLGNALRVLDRMVAEPEGATPEAIAAACTTVGEWATGRGYTHTAICFSEIAAHVAEDDSMLAAAAGRLLRQHAYFERSKQWFERAVGLARLSGDMSASASAYLSWANMEFHRGEHRRARKLFLRAWRRARKHHLRELGAAARHNLLALCIETGRFAEAQEHAEAAFELYGRGHEIIPTFAQDVAQLWSWQGYSDVALRVFSAALPNIHVPKERFITTANLGRAAAGAGRRDLFLDAWGEVARYNGPPNEYVAEALVNISEGALILGLASKALEAGTRALHLAAARRERATVEQAERVLARIRAGEVGGQQQNHHPPPDRIRALAGRLLHALEEAAPN